MGGRLRGRVRGRGWAQPAGAIGGRYSRTTSSQSVSRNSLIWNTTPTMKGSKHVDRRGQHQFEYRMYKHEDDSFVQMGGTTTIERLRGAAKDLTVFVEMA